MDKKLNHESEARAFAEKHIKAVPAAIVTVEVKVNLASRVLDSYAVELFANAQVAVEMKGGTMPFTEEEFVQYVRHLVRIRCDYVNNQRVPFGPTDLLAIPAFVSVVLQNLGKVFHLDLGLELVPVHSGGETATKGYPWQESDIQLLKKVSRGIVALGNYGLEYAKGYDRVKEGSFEFMSMSVLDDIVMGVNKEAHVVYALLASFVGLQGIERALSPRITYGTTRHFEILVRHLAQFKSS